MVKKKEEKKPLPVSEKKKIIKRQENQIRNFLLIMLFIFVFVFIMYLFYQSSVKFNYGGLEFEKLKEGDLILYRTPVFPIFLRNDPRDLRDIKIDSKIILKKKIGVGGNMDVIGGCEDSKIAGTTLSIFLTRSSLEPFSATRNQDDAEEFELTYIDCGLNLDYSAILFEKGEENKIRKRGNCYILEVKDCEIMKVAERFMVGVYAHSRGIEI